MKKIIGILIVVILISSFFLLGCTSPEEVNENSINTAEEASETIDDVSTDLSGLGESLNEIDDNLEGE